MYALRLRLARWVLANRTLSFVAFGLLTVFFAAGLPRVQLRTIFSDLPAARRSIRAGVPRSSELRQPAHRAGDDPAQGRRHL